MRRSTSDRRLIFVQQAIAGTARFFTCSAVLALLCGAVEHPASQAAATQPQISEAATSEPVTSQPVPPQIPTVSIHLQNVPREEALDAFARSAQVTFDAPAAGFWSTGNWPTPTIDLDIVDEPFWTALSHLQEALDVGFNKPGDSDHIAVTRDRGDWGWTGRPEAVGGQMLFSVRQVSRTTAVHFQDPSKPTDSISMVIQALRQPGAQWSVDNDGLQITSLVTDQGVEIESPKTPIPTQSYNYNGQPQMQFQTPAPRDPKITSLTLAGNCHCMIERGQETIEVNSAEQTPVDRSLVGFTVHIATHINAEHIEVRVTSKIPRGTDTKAFTRFGNRAFWIWSNRLRLYDSKGTELSSGGGGASSGSKTMEVYKNYDQANAVPPLRIEWTVPTAVDDVTVPVKIEDIPVP